jgi:hypothetical protein
MPEIVGLPVNDNLALWERVRTPHPSACKAFNNGKFGGTAINATMTTRAATHEWGPIGLDWHVEFSEEIIDGRPFVIDGNLCFEKIHIAEAVVTYPVGDKKGSALGRGATYLVRYNDSKNTISSDDEAPKKSRTDALTNALKSLGFAADVHMGLWDDNKYVDAVKAEVAGKANGNGAPKAKPQTAPKEEATQNKGEAPPRAPAPAQASPAPRSNGNGAPEVLKKLAAKMWSDDSVSLQSALADGQPENEGKKALMALVIETSNKLGLDADGMSGDDLVTLRDEIERGLGITF